MVNGWVLPCDICMLGIDQVTHCVGVMTGILRYVQFCDFCNLVHMYFPRSLFYW